MHGDFANCMDVQDTVAVVLAGTGLGGWRWDKLGLCDGTCRGRKLGKRGFECTETGRLAYGETGHADVKGNKKTTGPCGWDVLCMGNVRSSLGVLGLAGLLVVVGPACLLG